MFSAYDTTLLIYNLTLIPVVFFSVLFLMLSVISLFFESGDTRKYKKLKELPFVSVQIPTFNDPIAARCISKCLEFNYPKNKYEILIVDDSTNVETQKLLKQFEKENQGFVKYVHRKNRVGYKPGALKNAMKYTKGEILVIFDSDWIPRKDFLKRVVKPFSDEKIAIVQTKQGFYNHKTNLITRFAAYTLMAYHAVIMPINNKCNSVFFCGTAGAIRRKAFDQVGGWNIHSITEDSELSFKMIKKGWQTVYLDIETPSEVPDNFESLIKQQMRWCYGNARVFFDNSNEILFGKGLTFKQRFMITYFTMGNMIMPIIVLMTFFGLSGWFLGELTLFSMSDLIDFFSRFVMTIGFISMGALTLYRRDQMNEFKHLIASLFTIGILIAVANSFAFIKAATNKPLSWYCTPKRDNSVALENAS